jgi:signal transduction histidine kinase
VFGSIAFYFVLQYVLIRQLDESLRAEQQEVVDFVKSHDQLPVIQNTKHQWITVIPANEPIIKTKIKSRLTYNKAEDKQERVRQLKFSVTAGKQMYLITVNKSETETEELLKLIILVTIAMIAFMLISNYIINRKLVTRLWQPFYNTISIIKDYQIAVKKPLQLTKESIDEINLLNESLNQMTERIHQDYHALRSFTENASHEMQTPLAVIRSKVEALLQETEWKKESMQQLLAVEDATQRLSKLHQSLLLLTRLENGQFLLNEAVDLTHIISVKVAERQELIHAKSIALTIHCEQVNLFFHIHLAEMLISNLLNNAIRYTPDNGNIHLALSEKSFTISNTATNGSLQQTRLFNRFYKEEPSSEGTGLGLAIVKQICNAAGFTISYHFSEGRHIFFIQFIS